MKPFSYREAIRFHGHSGPFLALGYRAGEYVMEQLTPQKLKEIECFVETPGRTPYTCIMDGIQCSTQCTFGKTNLILKEVPKNSARITFRSRKKNKNIRLVLKSCILNRILNSDDMEKKVAWIRKQSIESLFEIEEKPQDYEIHR